MTPPPSAAPGSHRRQLWLALALLVAAAGVSFYLWLQDAPPPRTADPYKPLAPVRIFTGHARPFYGLSFYASGERLVAMDDTGVLVFWEVGSDKPVRSISQEKAWERGVQQVRDHKRHARAAWHRRGQAAAFVAVGAVGWPQVMTPVGLATEQFDQAARQATAERRRQFCQAALLLATPPPGQAVGLLLPPAELARLAELENTERWPKAGYYYYPWCVGGSTERPEVVVFNFIQFTQDEGNLPRRTIPPNGSRDRSVSWLEVTHYQASAATAAPTATYWVYEDTLPEPAGFFSRDGRELLLVDPENVWYLLRKTPGPDGGYTLRPLLFDPRAKRTALTLLPDGRRVLLVNADGAVEVWDADAATKVRPVAGLREPGPKLAVSLDSRHLVTWANDLIVWDLDTGQEARRCRGHQGAVTVAAFSPDGRRLLSAGSDRTLRLWDVASGREVAQLAHAVRSAVALAFSPDGRRAAAAFGNEVRVWDLPP